MSNVRIKVNVAQFNRGIQRKINRLEKQKSITNHRAARYCQSQAQLLAPKSSGKLANSIKVRRLKKGDYQVRVNAISEDGFPYPRWVNQSPGFEVLRFPRGGPRGFGLKPGSVAIYGRTPSWWDFSGTPRFFDKAVELTAARFSKLAPRQYAKAVGARIGGM